MSVSAARPKPSALPFSPDDIRDNQLVNIALKEWAIVIEALAQSRQHFLLRKGGIAEGKRGFEPKHSEFLLYPTWEHQQAESIQPEFHKLFGQLEPKDGEQLSLQYLAKVTDILPAPADITTLQAISDKHIWAAPYLEMRYQYRPDLPLYVMILRIFRLPQIVQIPEDRRYRGCRSWVDLNVDIDVTNAAPGQSTPTFEYDRNALLRQLQTITPAR